MESESSYVIRADVILYPKNIFLKRNKILICSNNVRIFRTILATVFFYLEIYLEKSFHSFSEGFAKIRLQLKISFIG